MNKLKCVIRGCAGKTNENIHLFRFPESDLIIWCQNLQLNPLRIKTSTRICSRHFSQECLGDGKKIKWGAHPTINLGTPNDDHIINSKLVRASKRKYLRSCHIPNCKSAHPQTLFRFPTKEPKRKQWLDRCGMPNDVRTQLFLCAKHFDTAMIGKGRLHKNAIPNRVVVEPKTETSILPLEADVKNAVEDACSNCNQLYKQIIYYRKRCSQLETRLRIAEKKLAGKKS